MTQVTHPSDQLDDRQGEQERALTRGKPIIGRASVVSVLVASVATVAGITGVVTHSTANDQAPGANAGASSSAKPTTTGQANSNPAVTAKPPGPTDSDERGFLSSDARCDQTQTAIAIGRTEKSLVVICKNQNGRYEYRGVRQSLGTSTKLDTVTVNGGQYQARNEAVTYTVTPKELVITTGDPTPVREQMLEFRSPPSGSAGTTAPPPPPPAPATPQASAAPPRPQAPETPVAGYPGLPMTAGGTGNGTVRFTATAPWVFELSVRCPPNTPVAGFIDASAPNKASYRLYLHGDSNSNRDGVRRGWRNLTGPITLTINPFDRTCKWSVSIHL